MTATFKQTLAALTLGLVCIVPAVQAGGSLDLSLADDAVRASWDATRAGSGTHVSMAWLHHEKDGDLVSGGLHVVDVRPSKRHLYIGVGGQLQAFSTEYYDGAALGVGGFFRYAFPSSRDVSLAGYVYYAPPVLSFADAQNMVNSDLRLQYSVIPSARVYLGYRYVSIRLEDVSRRYELGDGLHAGLTIDF